MPSDIKTSIPAVLSAGDNSTRIWGMTSIERLRRIARAADLPADDTPDGPLLIAAASHVFDPLWLTFMLARPGSVLTIGGVPVIAHVQAGTPRDGIAEALALGEPLTGGLPLAIIAAEDHRVFYNEALRKREEPMLERLEPASVRRIERQSYVGAYKGVTDVLTKYLWPEWALVLTRIAARIGMTPNQVTAIGAVLCVLATWLFWHGHYWPGMAAGLIFMVLDTVDGKLARCTITSSWWGNVFDHGMDLVHPPFWWWAWAAGLGAWGLGLSDRTFYIVQAAMLAGYVLQRVIEGGFINAFGMHIHVWQKFDSDFRLVTARRNPNMVILFFATLFGRPDIGIEWVAGWTVLSLIVHAVRFAQATMAKRRGETLVSWLAT